MSLKAKKLGSLADIFQAETLDGTIAKIKLAAIIPSKVQPRWDATHSVQALSESISRDGLLSPIVVCKEGDQYRIIAGERRFHAVSKLNYEEVDCRIISRSEKDYWRIAVIENIQRENLLPWEEAVALAQLKKNDQLNDAEVGELIGKSRNYVSEILSLSELPENVIDQAKKMGITQLNMMIQVAHAYKNGSIDTFLHAYRDGEIDTVQKAKGFRRQNKMKQNRNPKNKKNAPLRTVGAEPLNSSFDLMHRTSEVEIWGSEQKNQIHIFCTNVKRKEQLLSLLIQETRKTDAHIP